MSLATNDFCRWWDGLPARSKTLARQWANGDGSMDNRCAGALVAVQYAQELYLENPGRESFDDALPDLLSQVEDLILEVPA